MAKIKDEDIDLLRERADVVEVISAYTQLKKSGARTFKGLCPFHSEKTPSFSVDGNRGLYFCFGCGEGGNVYHFIEKVENLSFPEAVEWLARREGFDLRYEEQRPGERLAQGLKLRIIEANEEATRFFHGQLLSSAGAEPARTYLQLRGFDRDVAIRWELGFAPGRDALTRHLLGRGFTQEVLLKADLVRKSERDGSLYDTFRRRIVFPTRSHQGDVVGFGARLLPGEEGPKYLNTSETPVFEKSRFMFGLHRAKSTLGRGNPAVVVEGYTDVIALHEAGIDQAVATNGVALGETHFELLKKFTQRLVLMFDADEAGKGATERGFDLQHKLGIEVLVVPLPSGSDPADVVTQEEGAERVRKYVDEAQPLMEFKLEQTIARLPIDTPEARARAVDAVTEVLGWHPDPVARGEYAFLAARRIGVDPESIQRSLAERRTNSGAPGGRTDERLRRLPGHVKVEREALQLLLTRTQDAGKYLDGLDDAHFTSPARRELLAAARAAFGRGEQELTASASASLSPDARVLFTELALGAAEDDPDDPVSFDEVFGRLRIFTLERDIKARRETLQQVNPLNEPDRHDEMFTELVALEAERRDLLRKLRETS